MRMSLSDPAELAQAPADRPRLVLLTGHSAPVSSVALSPDGKTLASGSYDSSIVLWDYPSGTMVRRLEVHRGNSDSLAFSLGGETLASADWEAVRLWVVPTGRWNGTLPASPDPSPLLMKPMGCSPRATTRSCS
jgi:WD40 repeat protein